MAHWLDEQISEQNREIGRDLNLSKDGIEANINENKQSIESFIDQLTFLFNKLQEAMSEEFEFATQRNSPSSLIDCERVRFDAVNATQNPVFIRRLDFIVCDKPGEFVLELFRAKRKSTEDPWKFHDEQKIICNTDKLTEENIYELIDWFAWKNYFPRSIRRD